MVGVRFGLEIDCIYWGMRPIDAAWAVIPGEEFTMDLMFGLLLFMQEPNLPTATTAPLFAFSNGAAVPCSQKIHKAQTYADSPAPAPLALSAPERASGELFPR